MKFACDSCGTQYLISDEKVGSRGVKVRCKRCGNVVLVKPKAIDDQASQPSLDGATEPQGRPLEGEHKMDMGDELSDAFDKLLRGDVDLSGEEGEEDEEEGQETQVLDVSQLRQAAGDGGDGIGLDLQEQEKIERVFAEAESTSTGGVAVDEEEEEYYVAIDDQQVGPLKLKQVENLWQQGRISEKTLVWHPGLADWKPLQQVPELRYLLGSRPVSEQAAEAPPPQTADEQQWDTSGSSSLSALVEEELEAVKSSGAAVKDGQEGPISDGPFPDEEPPEEELPPWEREDVVSGEVARPSDSYFDPSLDVGGTGEIKLGTERVDIVKPAYLSGETGKKSKLKMLIVGAGAAVVILLVVVAWLVLRGESKVEKGDTRAFGKGQGGGAASAGVTRKGALVADAKAGRGSSASKTAAAGPGEGKGQGPDVHAEKEPGKANKEQATAGSEASEDTLVVKKTAVKTSTNESKTASTGARQAERQQKQGRKGIRTRGKKVSGKKGKKKSGESSSKKVAKAESSQNLPERLEKSQIKAVMVKHISAMKQCVKLQYERDPSIGGVMKLNFTITGSGRISNVSVTTAQHKGSFVAHCITAIFKKMVFPRFSGPPFTVRGFSLKLGR